MTAPFPSAGRCRVALLLIGAICHETAMGTESVDSLESEQSLLSALARVILLTDYNTRIVVIGVSLLGAACGVIGSFMLLRKRALLGDALSHATLPGIAGAFIIATQLGFDGKALPVLLLGATLTGIAGMLCILVITRFSRLREDAALGIVLSVSFGAGVALLSIVQNMKTGSAAGLESFIYGKTASMVRADAILIAAAAAAIFAICIVLFKEFSLTCFDAAFARTQGWPVAWLDALLMALVVVATVIGLQAVGLILIVALLIIPPAAARFWTENLFSMMLVSAAIGALSGYLGAATSALAARLPAGAVIVLVAGVAFTISALLGTRRGALIRVIQSVRLARKVRRQHLLRALFERSETSESPEHGMSLDRLRRARSWSAAALRRVIRRAVDEELVRPLDPSYERIALTVSGHQAAWRVTRNHRLWELFLIRHADIAPSHVDRDADHVEHVLGAEMIAELEAVLRLEHPELTTPPSPHLIAGPNGGIA